MARKIRQIMPYKHQFNDYRNMAGSYNSQALVGLPGYRWNDFEGRLFRYTFNEAYYENVIFDAVVSWVNDHLKGRGLYRYTRGIYNPAARLVDALSAKVYGGQLDLETGMRGAIPIAGADERLRQAIVKTWKWSNWNVHKTTYVSTGAKLGDSVVKVVDNPDSQKVYYEVLHPGKIRDIETDVRGNVKYVVIEYIRRDIDEDVDWVFNEVWDTDGTVYLYRDGEEFDRYDNPYGFIPMVFIRNKDASRDFGYCQFHNIIPKINEACDVASLLDDGIRRMVRPMIYVAGIDANQESPIEENHDVTRDEAVIVTGPEGSNPESLAPNVRADDALGTIKEILAEIENDAPLLAVRRLREKTSGDLSGIAVQNLLNDAKDTVVTAQGIYDDGLIRVQQMAVAIAGFRGYDGFEGFGLDSYDRGDLDHYIRQRDIIEDRLNLRDEVTFLIQTGAPESAIWTKMGADGEQVSAWESAKRQREEELQARRMELQQQRQPAPI